jgi:hypothetical protein
LEQQEIEDKWGTDADLLDDCRNRHALLLRYYKLRDQALRDKQN